MRQELRCEAERGGARAACFSDPPGKAVSPIADEGAHSFESGCLGGWSGGRIAGALDTSVAPGRKARQDCEYERNGTSNLFMMFAPLEGRRHVAVTGRHAAIDYAHALKDSADIHFLNAKKIVLAQDNLWTHAAALLYAAFPAAEARRLVERFEGHYTPKHGSWLGMAESEPGILAAQCLNRRIPGKLTLTEEAAAWRNKRNKQHVKADWQFTTGDARVKLKPYALNSNDSCY